MSNNNSGGCIWPVIKFLIIVFFVLPIMFVSCTVFFNSYTEYRGLPNNPPQTEKDTDVEAK